MTSAMASSFPLESIVESHFEEKRMTHTAPIEELVVLGQPL